MISLQNFSNSQESIFILFPPSFPACALGSSGNQSDRHYSFTACQASRQRESLHINVLRIEEAMGIGITCTMNFDCLCDVEFFFFCICSTLTLCICTLAATQGDWGKTARQVKIWF